MSNKRKRIKLDEQKAKQRLRRLAREGRLANGVEMPKGAVAADLSQQAPNNSFAPPFFYSDQEFTCYDCGAEEVWTAAQQKWYFEVLKAPIYGRAKRCRACRQAHRALQEKSRAAAKQPEAE